MIEILAKIWSMNLNIYYKSWLIYLSSLQYMFIISYIIYRLSEFWSIVLVKSLQNHIHNLTFMTFIIVFVSWSSDRVSAKLKLFMWSHDFSVEWCSLTRVVTEWASGTIFPLLLQFFIYVPLRKLFVYISSVVPERTRLRASFPSSIIYSKLSSEYSHLTGDRGWPDAFPQRSISISGIATALRHKTIVS